MINKKKLRAKRAKALKEKLKKQKVTRLIVNKSNCYLYAQVIDSNNNVVASASSLESEVKSEYKSRKNIEVAKKIGQLIAKRAMKKNISKISFDKNGYKYHGKIAAIADSAREEGLKF